MASAIGNNEVCPVDSSSFIRNLLRLPNEVLIMIFEMLPPTVLIELEKCNNQIIKTVAVSVRIGDFSPCWDCSEVLVESFVRSRSSSLKELYLDNLAFANPKKLAAAIRKCKQLKVLSVKNCGLTLEQFLYGIELMTLEKTAYLLSVKFLKCAYRSYEQINFDSFHFNCNPAGLKSIKYLHLDIPHEEMFIFFWLHCLPHCTSLISLKLVLSSVSYRIKGASDIFRWTSPVLLHLNKFSLIWLMPHHVEVEKVELWKETFLLPLLSWAFEKHDNKQWQSFWITDVLDSVQAYKKCKVEPIQLSRVASLFLVEHRVEDDYAQTLSMCEENVISQLGFFVDHIGENHVSGIKRAAGKTLQKLAIVPNLNDFAFINFSSFHDILNTCRNITDLDIRGIHATDGQNSSFCKAICVLKKLKRLIIPICVIAYKVSEIIQHETNTMFAPLTKRRRQFISTYRMATIMFEQMVNNCPLVEEFGVDGCRFMTEVMYFDGVLTEMYKWSHLKHLSLDHVTTLKQCTFLRKVATSCPNFTSFRLVYRNSSSGMIHMPILTYILYYAKNLTFLRIVAGGFTLNNEEFWKGIAAAQNLRGLCITVPNLEPYALQNAYRSIKQLKYFHVLHLYYQVGHVAHDNTKVKLEQLLKRKCKRNVENNYFIIERIQNSSYFFEEPECHAYHCGILDIALVLP